MMNYISCSICGHRRLKSILAGRRDREYALSIQQDYFRCENASCGHVQVLPIPNEAMIASFYTKYSTHNLYRPHGLARVLDFFNEKSAINQLIFLNADFGADKQVHILDFGCGNGQCLRRLSSLGYNNLMGFDFDAQAVALVLSQGIPCSGDFSELSKKSFDVIFINHVVEHLPDPAITINSISNLLSSGGILMIRTPNSLSFLARLCGVRWRGWETPRHLNIFSFRSLGIIIDSNPSLIVSDAYTSNAMLAAIAIASLPSFLSKIKILKIFCAAILVMAGMMMSLISSQLGEEIVYKIKVK